MRHPHLAFVLAVGMVVSAAAQSKLPVTRGDYGQWETLAAGGAGGGFSPDGDLARLHDHPIESHNGAAAAAARRRPAKTVAVRHTDASSPPNSKWAACSIGYTEAEQERMRYGAAADSEQARPVRSRDRRADDDRRHSIVQLQRRRTLPRDAQLHAGGYAGRPDAGPTASAGRRRPARGRQVRPRRSGRRPAGATIIVRDSPGRDTTFGNVGEHVWQDRRRGHLLALARSARTVRRQRRAAVRSGNGGAASARLGRRRTYTGLTWRKDSDRSGVPEIEDRPAPRRADAGRAGVARSRRPPERAMEFDPASTAGMPAGMRTVSFRRPSWSDDGKTCSSASRHGRSSPAGARTRRGAGRIPQAPGAGTLGTTPVVDPPGGDPGRFRRGPAGRRTRRRHSGEIDEPAAVEVWHWADADVMARQKLSLAADRRRNLLAAWHLDAGRLVHIGKRFEEQVAPIAGDTARLRREVDGLRDGSLDRPSRGRSLSRRSGDRRPRSQLKDRVDDALCAGQSRRPIRALPPGRSVLDDQSGNPRDHQHHEGRRRPRSSIASRTRRRSRSRPLASPAGRKTTGRWSCTTSSTSGR